MIWVDSNTNILQWSSEQIVVPYFSKADNKPRRYFVDFYIKYKNKQGDTVEEIIEVKPKAETLPPVAKKGKRKSRYLAECLTFQVNIDKWAAACEYAKKRGWSFRIITEDELF